MPSIILISIFMCQLWHFPSPLHFSTRKTIPKLAYFSVPHQAKISYFFFLYFLTEIPYTFSHLIFPSFLCMIALHFAKILLYDILLLINHYLGNSPTKYHGGNMSNNRDLTVTFHQKTSSHYKAIASAF